MRPLALPLPAPGAPAVTAAPTARQPLGRALCAVGLALAAIVGTDGADASPLTPLPPAGASASAANDALAARAAPIWSGQCGMCHQIGAGAEHQVGPHLNGILGRRIGAEPGFAGYSASLQAMGDDGTEWTEPLLRAFLYDPYAFAPDTRMGFGGLHDAADLDALVAWLGAAGAAEAPLLEGYRVAPEVLALEGDIEWGAFLAAECVTCHQGDGSDRGLPGIAGWPTDGFVTVMHAYRARVRPNITMQTIAARLSDDEIAALAAYFATLEREAH